MTALVGIDLGTTYSAVAHVGVDGRPAVIPDDTGEPLTPSVVSFATGEPIVGAAAKDDQAGGETEVAATFKRSMGDLSFMLTFGGRDYDATDLSALVLRKLAAQAARHLGVSVSRAVVTVPAHFTHPQRAATIEAGRRAGLDVRRIISEPTAAALAYGLRPGDDRRRVLVYDLGGGTFDVSLVEITADELRVIGTGGDHLLGGRDWDERLVEHLRQRFLREFGVDPFDTGDGAADRVGGLLVKAEQLKRALSARQAADVQLTAGGHKARLTVTREAFEIATRDLLLRTEQLTDRVLADVALAWTDVDGVLPVGGSTRMPMVKQWIRDRSGKDPLGGIHPDQAVALGAAVQAALLTEAAGEDPLGEALALGPSRAAPRRLALPASKAPKDVVAHSLGLIAESEDGSRYRNSILIRRNLSIPATCQRPYRFLLSGDDDLLEVFLTQGETDDPATCAYLGRYAITGFTAPAGAVVVDIAYAYDDNGIVHVSATEQGTGASLHVQVDKVAADVPERFLGRPSRRRGLGQAAVYLAFDLSGSMTGKPLAEAKRAAETFVAHCDLTTTSIGLIGFSDRVRVATPATGDALQIGAAIRGLREGATGYGNAGDPFDQIHELLADRAGARYAIVLADGVWARQELAVERARRCHAAGIETIAIGFGGADEAFLRRIASSSEQSLFTDLSQLTETFGTIARELTEGGGRVRVRPRPHRT